MKIIRTDLADPSKLSLMEKEWIYNGLDCCVTLEVLQSLLPQLDDTTATTYTFSRTLQGPVLEMRCRGMRVDNFRKAQVLDEYQERLDVLQEQLERIVAEGVGFFGFNWRSTKSLVELFYDKLGLPTIRRGGRPTVDREAIERMEQYTVAKPIVRHLEAMRDLDKRISMLKTDIDIDSRVRTSYNIGGTTTGRLSSSFSEFGTGTNLQNIEESLRSIFIADPGMKLAYFDAEQGESRVVGAIEWNLFNDPRYLDACEDGDLHTTVAKLCWPQLAWTNDLKADKALAEEVYYRHYSRRFMCKKIGHGSNYGGKPRTLAAQTKVEVDVIEDFQPKYFSAFPAHLQWHESVRERLISTGTIVSLIGRQRQFWGRRTEDSTLREAIAFDPQGSLADIVNQGMLQVWRARDCELLLQVHDAIVVQFPEEKEDEVVPKLKAQLRYPITLANGREFVIPYGCKTGWNWGVYNAQTNHEGLKDYAPNDKRKREAAVRILDRVIRSKNRKA